MSDEIREATQWLREGGVICYPCEGVWGFGCDPFDETAVSRVLSIKQREQAKGLIVIAHNAEQFRPELDQLNAATRKIIASSWPGRVTWLLPTDRFPDWITGYFATVAGRVPDHEQARTLAKSFNSPIVSTSANVADEPPCLSEEDVRNKFSQQVDYILSGSINHDAGASEIFSALNGERIR